MFHLPYKGVVEEEQRPAHRGIAPYKSVLPVFVSADADGVLRYQATSKHLTLQGRYKFMPTAITTHQLIRPLGDWMGGPAWRALCDAAKGTLTKAASLDATPTLWKESPPNL